MERLLTWSKSVGIGVHESIDLRTSGEFGSQGTAIADIPANSELCSIPFSQCITPELACKAFNLPFDEICAQNLETAVLAAYLLHEKNAQGSPWSAYIAALPQALDTPAFWSDEDLEWLRGTNLDGEVDVRRARMVEQVGRLAAMIKSPKLTDNEDDWKWAYGIIHSRSFPSVLLYEHADRSASHPVLLPVLDTFNHRPGTAITWSPDYAAARLSFVSGATCPAGTQIFNNYGAKSNEEFLMSYGVCLADSASHQLCLKLPDVSPSFYLTADALVPEDLLSAMAERLEVDLATDLGQVVALDSLGRALSQKGSRLVGQAPPDDRPPANGRQSMARLYREGQLALVDAAIAQTRRLVRERLDHATATLTVRQVWSAELAGLLGGDDGEVADVETIEQGELCGLELADIFVACLLPSRLSSLLLLLPKDRTTGEVEEERGEVDEFWSHFGDRIAAAACTPITTREEFAQSLSMVEAAAWRDEEDGRTYYLDLPLAAADDTRVGRTR